ncbi:MAG: penicillin acylase family protein [Planctomycetes bacterium]|nr:penicillin acylase family protein [Planctomycetota bacterium]
MSNDNRGFPFAFFGKLRFMHRLLSLVFVVLLSCPVYAGYKATIVRDTFGVPHIFGKTEADVAFGFGYAQAEDQLDTILRNYVKASGREAAAFGAGYIESDTQTHLLRIPETVAEKYDALPQEVKDYLAGFAAGVARYMKTHADNVPAWASPPTPQDVLAHPYYLFTMESFRAALSEGHRLMPPIKKEEKEKEGNRGAKGCNLWAVMKEKTKSGHAMLQMDRHMPYLGSAQWYEAHLCGGSLNVVGATTFGHPFIQIGHNENIAWGVTGNSPDLADVYFEKMNPEDRGRYEYDNDWLDVKVRKVKLGVLQSDGKVAEKEVGLEYTHHGPVFLHTHEKLYSAKWTLMDSIDFATQFYKMSTAGGVDEFKKAMSILGIPSGNYLCADTAGNIYYLYNARVQSKSEDFNWYCPVPGWTSETDWGERIPFGELPQTMNPDGGFLQNCNDPPGAVSPDCDIDVDDAPSYLVRSHRNSPGVRGERATELLEKTEKLDLEAFKKLSFDNRSIYIARAKNRLLDAYALRGMKGGPKVEQALKLLKRWDSYVTADNVAWMFYKMWQLELRQGGSAPKGTKSRLLAMQRAVDRLEKLYGKIDVKWGPHHVIERGGKSFPVATGGSDAQTLFMATGSFRDGKWVCSSGSSYMMAVELSKPPKSFSLFPMGMSNDPASPHHTDQTALYSRGKYKPIWFTQDDIAANKEKEYTVESK